MGEFWSIRDEWSSVRVEFSLTSDGCNSIRDERNAMRDVHCTVAQSGLSEAQSRMILADLEWGVV